MTKKIIFQKARLFDGISDGLREDMSVCISDGKIGQVVKGRSSVPEGYDAIDLAGKCLLPGLIDTHVHATLIGEEALPLFLAAGVTSARDVGGALGAVLDLRSRIADGTLLGPRLFVCGPLLDGSTPSLGGPAFEPMLQAVPAPDAVPEIVGNLIAAGVDGIKLYFSLTPDIATEIIRFVDKRLPVTGHLGWTHSLEAIEAGIDGLEHVWISPYNEFCALDMQFGVGASMMDPTFWTKTLKGWEEADLNAGLATQWFDSMVEKQVHMGSTLDLLWTSRSGIDGAMKDPDRKLIPKVVRERQRAIAEQMGDRPDWDIHNWFFEASQGAGALEKHQEVTRLLHERGGIVVGGTDCGAIPFPPPGFSLLREIELLSDSMGAVGALKSVTSTAARYLRSEDEIGIIKEGNRADFLIVNGDPTNDVTDLRKLEDTYVGGVRHTQSELRALI